MKPNHFGCVGNTIKAWAGHYVDLENPTPDMFDIETIAAALSKICRFGGHCPRFYSVAEHCVHATNLAYRHGHAGLMCEVLLHDAAEAYVGDVVKPLKMLLPQYQAIESKIEAAIAQRFRLDLSYSEEVKLLDRLMLKAEKQAMWPDDAEQWVGFADLEDEDVKFCFWEPREAQAKFLLMASYIGLMG